MSKILGIILAAGKSSRLYPATIATTKQLLPIYDKPLIYYPLTTLMLAGIRDILVITNPWETEIFENLLGNADEELGMNIDFAVQDAPKGIPEAFSIAQKHYGDTIKDYDQIVLILGDNVFYGAGLSDMIIKTTMKRNTATVFLQRVADPERFGVAEFNKQHKIIGLEEKPKEPKSNYAVTGLYFFPGYAGKWDESLNVFDLAAQLRPSGRGELEITDLLRPYLEAEALNGNVMLRGMSWFDTGTPDSLIEAAVFIKGIQTHQGFLVGSPHEIAYNYEWVSKKNVLGYLKNWGEKTAYGRYLLEMING